MGRELQKKKKRSGRQPVRRKRPSKKQILSNPVIAENWNSRDTLSRNYQRLGLVSKLNFRAGGAESRKRALLMKRKTTEETDFEGFDEEDEVAEEDSLRIVHTEAARLQRTVAEVHIERDASGQAKVLHSSSRRDNPLNDPLNDILSDDDESGTMAEWGPLGYVGSTPGPKRGVVGQLEAMAESGERKAPRKQSTREEEWIERLVSKHGDDFRAMSRDVRLNPMQQSEGDIRRRARKWSQKTATG